MSAPDPRIASLRHDYHRHGLLEADTLADPIAQFDRWLDDAIRAPETEPTAMTLATCTPDGKPSARIVLLKGLEDGGFVFYTNRESHKGREIAANPHVALVFHWVDLERQVRVEGTIGEVDDATSDAYFASRPRGSQLGAWASAQSRPVSDRDALERALADVTARFDGRDVPRPPHWGGYRVTPALIEFWQGRRNRMHDRLVYVREGDGWTRGRVAP